MTDGQGYYAYLPAIFIYHDLQFGFVDNINDTYYEETKRARYVVPTETGTVNKYFVGTAIVQTPFFLAGCALSSVAGLPVDGYSWPFQLMVGIGAIACLILGLYFLGLLLVELGSRSEVALVVLMFVAFGTNLLYYTIYEPSMSHVYSFFTVSAFLFYGRKALMSGQNASIFFAGVALSLTVLIRPINGLVILALPVVAGGTADFLVAMEAILRKRKQVLLTVLLGLVIVLIQPLIYWLQTGHPLVWSYQEEGFNFSSPELINVLFSYRKGLFVYCPILFLAIGGIIVGSAKRKPGFGELLIVLALITWVVSSWWMWYYGGSYGQRPFIEFYPLFAIGLAYSLDNGIGILKPWFLMLLGFTLVAIQLIQTYQYVEHIIPFDGMTKSRYWNLFLRTGDDLAWYYSPDRNDSYLGLDSVFIKHNMEEPLGWVNEQQLTSSLAFQGSGSARMSSEDQYGPTLHRVASGDQFDLVRVSAWVRSDSRTTDLMFVCAIEDSTGQSYYWDKRLLRPQFKGTGNWSWVTAVFRCGLPKDSSDTFVVYPMKTDNAEVFFDELEVSFISTY